MQFEPYHGPPLTTPPQSTVARARRIAGAVLGAVLMITVAVVVTRPESPRALAAGTPAQAAADDQPDPIKQLLQAQAAALLRGDKAAWLAAVDPARPALRKRYLGLYTSLRGLRISHFEYHLDDDSAPAKTREEVEIAFCFSGDPCPDYVRNGWDGPPRIAQALTFKAAGTGFVITDLARAAQPTHLQPTPWEAGDLVIAQGRRVTVAAPPALAARLPEAVRIADRAAAVDDRYAVLVGNPQRRYRVYLATAKTFRSWYSADLEGWVAGFMQPLNDVAADVVIDVTAIQDRADLRTVLQHELGHVATVGGTDEAERWLSEGVAEYIGWQPRPPGETYNAAELRRVGAPRSIAMRLGPGASTDQAAAFYARSHFAVQCMATMYGERGMLDFVRHRLRLGETLDDAARAAYGKPFATVDKACVKWIKMRVG